MVSPPQAMSEQDLRDLGFGSVVSRESRQRLLNRDGSFNVERRGLGFWSSFSLYHVLLTMPWWKFVLVGVVWYLAANLIFAGIYAASGPDALVTTTPALAEHPFLRAFFFSVETLSTIGYGNIVPTTVAVNLVVTLEALFGLMGLAVVTGFLFARFSRPTAKLIFSSHAVIAPYRGIRAFEFRVANARSNELIQVSATVLLSRFEDVDGARTRRYYPLALEREKVVFLPLTWTVVHPIEPNSPMFGETPQSLHDSQTEILVLVSAFDETFSTTVQTRISYTPDETIWGARFASAFMVDAAEKFADSNRGDGKITVDMRLFDKIERAVDALDV
jgi:inward rectifier potassium channel